MNNCIIKEDVTDILRAPLPWNNLSGKSFLVTGASGFIGSYIVETLLALKNVEVLALVRNEKKAKYRFDEYLDSPNFKLLVQDVCEQVNLDRKIDFIVHAASQASPKFYGKDPVGTLKANTSGTLNLLELAKKSQTSKFVFVSSCEVYGKIDGQSEPIHEDFPGSFSPLDVRSCYGESKRMGENMCICYSHQFGIKTSIIRPAHTYGPGLSLDDGRVFCDFIKNAVSGENIQLNSDGKSSRKFLYISDFIIGFFTVFFYGKDKEAYNITADEQTTIEDLAHLIISLCPQKNLRIQYAQNNKKIDNSSGYIKSPSSSADFSSDKIKKLSWKPEITISKGFERMLKSYKNQ